jgi:hypothetical protein
VIVYNRGDKFTERMNDDNVDKGYPDYYSLDGALQMAYDRATVGKGKERHAHGQPFGEQYICRAPKLFGLGALLYQIGKKNEEIMGLDTDERKINELLDIIVYAAAGVILLQGSK